jgi:ATP-dependent metalloprotease FtsH|tara:strand:+ start:195 stop:3299 length:3105 start_codon:yes stop_codon:yes gene_type:complete
MSSINSSSLMNGVLSSRHENSVKASTTRTTRRQNGQQQRGGKGKRGNNGVYIVARQIKPKGMSQEKWEQMQKQQDKNYKLFSKRAKERIATQGPRINDTRGTETYLTYESVAEPLDLKEPKWSRMKELPMREFQRAINSSKPGGMVRTFEVWEPPMWGYLPPPPLRTMPRKRWYKVTLGYDLVDSLDATKIVATKDTEYIVKPATETLEKACRLIAEQRGVWYTYHQKYATNRYGQLQFIGMAVGGFVFLMGSIYLGIMKKNAIPTDLIQAVQFAQSGVSARKDGTVNVTLEDIGGLENIKEDLDEIIRFLKDPTTFTKVGAKPPKGILMEGGPGVGKTLLAKAIAGEAKVPFYSMAGSEFVEIIVGVGAARVRDLFKRARLNAPCLIFVDEIDALGTARASAGTRGTEEHEQTLNQLLTEMDGFTPDTGVVFIGATNRADLLDPALLRPGRFDRKIEVNKPNVDARQKILQIHLSKRNVNPDIDTARLARNLPGMTGAEIASVVNEAAVHCVRREGSQIEEEDVMYGSDRVLYGVRGKAHDKDELLTKLIACHEVGRAVVQETLRKETKLLEPCEFISIVPRGFQAATTLFSRFDDNEYMYPTRERLMERVEVLTAGVEAEKLVYDEVSSYGTDYGKEAIDLLRNVVINQGLGQPGMLTAYTHDPTALSGYDLKTERMRSTISANGENVDVEENKILAGNMRVTDKGHLQYAERKIFQIMKEARENSKSILTAYKAAVKKATEELVANETLSGDRLRQILDEYPPAGDYAKTGPDTPCKILPTEEEEMRNGWRNEPDPLKKFEYLKQFYGDISLDPPGPMKDRRTKEDNAGLLSFQEHTWKYAVEKVLPKKGRRQGVHWEPWTVAAMKMNERENPGWRAMEIARLWKEHEAYLLPKMQKVVQELNEKRDGGEKLTREEERKLIVLPEQIAEIEGRIENGYPEGAGLGVMDLKIPDKFVFNIQERMVKEKQRRWYKDNVHPMLENMDLDIFAEDDLRTAYRKKEAMLHKLDPDRPLPEGYTAPYKPGVTKERWF